MKLRSLALLIVVWTCSAYSAESTKVEAIRQLLEVSNLRGTLEEMRLQNVAGVREAVLKQGGPDANNPVMQRLVARMMEKYDAYSHEIFDPKRAERDYIALYDELLSEAEIKSLIAMYESDGGKILLRITPILAGRAQVRGIERSQNTEGKMQQLMDETVKEIQAELTREGNPILQKPAATTKP